MPDNIPTSTTIIPQQNNGGFDMMVIKFADSRIPQFKEVRNKDYIYYGEDNLYPNYLLYLYNKSDRHNAIINGKTKYICGSDLEKKVNIEGGFNSWFDENEVLHKAKPVNRNGELMFDVMKKSQKDIEIFGGFRWAITKDFFGRVAEIFHIDFSLFRKAKDKAGFYYKEDWSNHKEEPIYYSLFDPNDNCDEKCQIFAYDEYRPGVRHYPLPCYIATNNYIEVDIEISKFHLSGIKNGMTPSKMIQFYTGEPDETKKRAIEKRFQSKFGGSENAGRFVLVFNNSKEKTVDVQDLSPNDLGNQFDLLNKTCEQHIITGHEVVSPMLFGIKTEGQLGGSNELLTAYQVFINTYGKPKQDDLIKIVNYFGGLMSRGEDYSIKQLEPVHIVITDELLKNVLLQDEIRELAGLPKLEKPDESQGDRIMATLSNVNPMIATKILENLTQDEIRQFVNLGPVPPGSTPALGTPGIKVPVGISPDGSPAKITEESQVGVNENIKNLTAKQHQQLLRIIRQYSKGQLNEMQARGLLKLGLGLSDEDINDFLGIEPNQQTQSVSAAPKETIMSMMMSFDKKDYSEDDIIMMFNLCGDLKSDFHIITNKRINFNSNDAAQHEIDFFKGLYATSEITNAEASILDLIKKDGKITPDVIASTIGSTPEYVASKIASLTKRGLLSSKEISIGDDTEIQREVTDKKYKSPEPAETTQIFIKYSYEVKPGIGPAIIPTTRPFCKKMIQLDRLYSRSEIELISQRLGYSVWDRRGGWWGSDPTCRHMWVSHVVVKKGSN